jgi:transcriptional antiterminator RfaH
VQSAKLEKWYLVKTKARQEQRAVDNLAMQLIEAYCPEISEIKLKCGKKTISREPLFPGYLFVRFDPHFLSVTTIQSTRGVGNIVRFGDYLAVVPDTIIEEIRLRCNQLPQQFQSNIPMPGDKVVITEGGLKGLEAVYQIEDGLQRAFILIDLLGKQQKVSIENQYLQKR